MNDLPSESWSKALPASDVIGSAEAESAVVAHARVLAAYYHELIRQHVPPELANELVVEMDERISPGEGEDD